MANPYKKAEEINKKSPGGVRREVTTTVTAPVVEEPKAVEEAEVPAAKQNLLDGLIKKKQEGKSYGFYLSKEAKSKLEKLAKQNGCSESKALDTLLRSIL